MVTRTVAIFVFIDDILKSVEHKEDSRGKQCSMCRYFYGVKVQLLSNAAGIPVEFSFVPGSQSNVKALDALSFSLSAESKVYADSAYTNYLIEDDMKDAELIEMRVVRKSNSKRKDSPYMAYLKECMRKRIETTISEIKGLFLRKIHAVTLRGFLLKLILFIFCFQLDKIFINKQQLELI